MSNGTFLALAAAGVALVASGIGERGSFAKSDRSFAWYYERRTMDPSRRELVNQGLRDAGMDGNGRFDSVGASLNAMWSVLGEQGMEITSIPSAHLFKGDSGSAQLRVGWKDTRDPFMERMISDSVLYITWHLIRAGKYEIVAHLS